MKIYRYISVVVFMQLLVACQQSPAQNVSQPLVKKNTIIETVVAPDIDNSKSVPDCIAAGNRIAQYVEVGMAQKDVRRLVGKPTTAQGSHWGWARGAIAYPGVRFLNGVVSTYGADTSACK